MNDAHDWDIAPLMLLTSAEPALGDRALDSVKARLRARDPNISIVTLDSSAYWAHELETHTTPSLFGEARAVIIPNLESASKALVEDLGAYIQAPEPDVVLILRHNGAERSTKLLDTLRKAGSSTLTIAAVKKYSDKVAAVHSDVRAAGRRITSDAVAALIDALGSDLRELLAGTAQLIADTTGQIDVKDVHTYFAGRLEATGFAVAEAAIIGNTGRAIELARHALARGTTAVAIVSAVELSLRDMARVLGTRSASGTLMGRYDASHSSRAPWIVERAKKRVRSWGSRGLAEAIEACAQADAEVKGASRDPEYAVEKLLLSLGRLRTLR